MDRSESNRQAALGRPCVRGQARGDAYGEVWEASRRAGDDVYEGEG